MGGARLSFLWGLLNANFAKLSEFREIRYFLNSGLGKGLEGLGGYKKNNDYPQSYH